jgi:3-oxoacyl-[acyl-carrier protein] reductase
MDDSPDSGKPVAIVTGSRAGLGKSIAQALVARGYLVVGCARNTAEWTLPGYEHFVADVSDEKQVVALVNHVRRAYSRLDVTINNAGVAAMNHSLLVPAQTIHTIMDVNIGGTFLVSRESAKLMQRRKYGRIVNLTTVAVPMRLEGESVYAASKAAVETLTHVLAREFAAFGITVNAVGPSPVDTDLIRNVPHDKIDSVLNRLAIKRKGTPADVMNVIDFFLRRESDYITGQVLYLGGV